jgi:hypothetical protein
MARLGTRHERRARRTPVLATVTVLSVSSIFNMSLQPTRHQSRVRRQHFGPDDLRRRRRDQPEEWRIRGRRLGESERPGTVRLRGQRVNRLSRSQANPALIHTKTVNAFRVACTGALAGRIDARRYSPV